MVGFIGVGTMGGTLAKIAKSFIGGENILVSSRCTENAERFAAENGVIAASNEAIAQQASVIFLGVKPHQIKEVLQQISPVLKARTADFALVSMAAGVTTKQIEDFADCEARVLRIMPNTPSLIGMGTIPYCKGRFALDSDCEELTELLESGGAMIPMDEKLFDAASAVAGCGPAFVYIFIEALADAGVACGLPRQSAIALAAQMSTGAAQMVLQTGKHTGELKDAVCSPGGSTIAGVCALDENGFRNAVQKAVMASFEKNQTLDKKILSAPQVAMASCKADILF